MTELNITEAIQELSNDTGIHAADIRFLAESVKRDLVASGVNAESFMKLSPVVRRDLTEAYLISAIRKFEKMQSQLSTDTEKRRAFSLEVLSLLKERVAA